MSSKPTNLDQQKAFLSSPHFAVVGASTDKGKYGTKVLNWYKVRSFSVTPVHHKESELEGIPTVPSISKLPSPKETSISVITPPSITLNILKQAKDLGVPALWVQPGAQDETVITWIRDNEMTSRVIYGGPCILTDGDGVIRSLL